MDEGYYEGKLAAALAALAVNCEHLVFDRPCATVTEAAETAGVRPEDIVKAVCLRGKDSSLLVAVVRGSDRVDLDKVGRVLRIRRPRLAGPLWVEEKSGYPAGGTPPLGFEARFVLDRRVLTADAVYCGGGSRRSLLRIRPSDILTATGASVGDIAQSDERAPAE